MAIQNVQFDSIIDYTAYNRKSLTDRWMTVSGAHINASSDRFEIASVVQSGTFLRDLRVNRFRMTFFAPGWNNYVAPAFHGKDFDTLDYVVIRPYINQTATASGRHVVGGNDTSASGTTSPLSAGSDFWFRLEFDGTTLTLKGKQGTSAPDESTWSSLGTLYSSTDFDFDGGYIGFLTGTVDTITIETDRDNNGSYETVEHIDHLTLDGSGFADSEPTHDPAGNLTYDGVHAFTYDAWNRLVKVTKAYRDPSSGNVTLGSVVNEIEHDGLGRRIVKQVKNSADLDCTYKYYHDGQRVIEERNGSDQVIKQHVWGALYIDELVQTG